MVAWQQELRDAMKNTAAMTDGNRLVLAYQFEQAREKNPHGFTMNLYGEVLHPATGYSVALTPKSYSTIDGAIQAVGIIQDRLGFQDVGLGYWSDDGKDYIDVVMVTQHLSLAQALGEKNQQKAIWDFAAGSEIWLEAKNDA